MSCGVSCKAPNAVAKLQANSKAVTMEVRRYFGMNNSPILGRLSVPASFFFSQAGDSGRNGRMKISGKAGITPEIKVQRQASCSPRIAGNCVRYALTSKKEPVANMPPNEENA